MAWISVHESLDGAKLRNLYKKLGCSKFEAVGILNFLWFWGLSNADKYGLILYVDREDVERHIFGAGAGCKIPPDKIVDALIETGWLDVTENGMYIHDWEMWQEQWYKAKERREKDTKRKRESRGKSSEAEKNNEPQLEDCPADVPTDKLEEITNDTSVPKEIDYTPAFEMFWKNYPRKVGKGEAYKKYKARRNDGYSDDELLEAAKNYAFQCTKLNTEKQYIKHPKTFLSDSMPFIDFIPKKEEINEEEGMTEGNPYIDWKGSSQ